MSIPKVWPDGMQAAVTITVNFAGESVEHSTMELPLWGRYSYGRYGAQHGVDRLLDVFERFGIQATFFIGGWDAERYPQVMEAIARAGHEVAGYGYLHEDFSGLTPDEQRAVLDKSETAHTQIFGRKPTGFRAPEGLMTRETRDILVERGYRFDSSYCDDDIPYVVVGESKKRIVELPHVPAASDRLYYQHYRAPSVVAAALREEFDAMYEVGGLCNLTLHPRGDYGSGRGVRIPAIEAVLQAIREHPHAWVTTCGQVADWMLKTAG